MYSKQSRCNKYSKLFFLWIEGDIDIAIIDWKTSYYKGVWNSVHYCLYIFFNKLHLLGLKQQSMKVQQRSSYFHLYLNLIRLYKLQCYPAAYLPQP